MLRFKALRPWLLILVLLSGACSQKPNSLPSRTEESANYSEAICQGPTPSLPNDAIIAKMHENVFKLRRLFRENSMSTVQLRGYFYFNGSDLGPTNPLYVSQKINTQYFDQIMYSLRDESNKRFYTWLVDGELPSTIVPRDLTYTEENYLGMIVSKIEGMFEMQQRLRINLCQGQQLTHKREKDIRDFAVLLNGECPRGLLYMADNDGNMISACLQYVLDEWESLQDRFLILKNRTYLQLRSLCLQLQDPQCITRLGAALSKGQGLAFWEELKSKYRASRYDNLFKIEEVQKNLSCSTTGRETKMHINVVFSGQISQSMQETFKRDFSEHVAQKWSKSSRFKIVFTFDSNKESNPYNLIVAWSNVPVSYVPDQQRNLMFLDKAMESGMTVVNRRAILAHEFGHVLGFPDCYIEFYEHEHDQFVFYQVDSRNIMCTISPMAYVPEDHFLQIIAKRCVY